MKLAKLTRTFHKMIFAVKDHSGTICAVISIGGVIATAYLSARAALKISRDISDDMSKGQKAKVVLKHGWKPTLSALATSACIFGSDRLHVRKEVGLAGLAAMLKKRSLAVDDKIRDIYGGDALKRIHSEVDKEQMKTNPYTGPAPDRSKGEMIVYEPYTDQYLKVTEEMLKNAYYEGNRRFVRDGELSLNFIIGYLGGDTTKVDDKYGWYYESKSQEIEWCYSGGWIEPMKDVYMYRDSSNKSGPLRYLSSKDVPTDIDIRCLFYDVDPIMPTNEDMMYSEECP